MENTPLERLPATVTRLRGRLRDARLDADRRALFALATGVLVERLRIGPAEAARHLTELADRADTSTLDLAADLIGHSAKDRLADTARAEDDPDVVRLRMTEAAAVGDGEPAALARSMLRYALAPLGARAVALWAAAPDSSLSLAAAAGFTAGEDQRWRYVPPQVDTVARRVLAERQTVWFAPGATPPSIGLLDLPRGHRAALPARVGPRLVGVVEVCWPGPVDAQAAQIRRQLDAIAELSAYSLLGERRTPAGERGLPAELVEVADGLLDPAALLLPWLDGEGRLVDFRVEHVNERFVDQSDRPRDSLVGSPLLELFPAAGTQDGLFERIERVYVTGQPFRGGDVPLIALVDEVPVTATAAISATRFDDCVLVTWRVRHDSARLTDLLQHAQRMAHLGAFEENLATGEATWSKEVFALHGLPSTADPIPVEHVSRHAHPDDAAAVARFVRTLLVRHRPSSVSFRLRRADGTVRHTRIVAEAVVEDGRLTAVRGAYQDVTAQHGTEVALAATRVQLAHAEQESAERNLMALRLQRAIMPPTRDPIETAGLLVAVRYRPAEKHDMVGGDWYDAVVLPDGKVLLSVGDIAGHGIDAATGMVVLRNALRGLAATGAGPGTLLTWLNLVACHLDTRPIVATALCGLYDPSTHMLRWARAGHLPPVLTRDAHATSLPFLPGLLLGARSGATYEENHLHLTNGDRLLMYTDGLIERRGSTVDESIAHLLRSAATKVTTLEQHLDTLLSHSDADTDDDTCVVGIEVLPTEAP